MIQKFLRIFWRLCAGFFRAGKNPASLPSDYFEKQPAPHEPLARFIYERKGRIAHGMAKPKAFLPDNNGETSVFRTIDLDSLHIRNLSASAQPKAPLAVATIKAKFVYGIGLIIDPNNKPYRHANIVNWPNDKYERKDLALALMQHAVLEEYS